MTKKQSTDPKPMVYGPYKITSPDPTMPLPAWHLIGPCVHIGSTDEKYIRREAIQANAIYQAAFKAGVESTKGTP